MWRILALLVGWSTTVAAQRYEGWSPVTMAPYGPVVSTGDLPEWVEVVANGRTTEVTFAPERRVRWVLVHGPDGVIRKRILVDGDLWADSRFTYVAGGLTRKTVSGPVGAQAHQYQLDGQGRIVRRSMIGGSLEVRWRWGSQIVRETWKGAQMLRRETYALSGELLGLQLGSVRLRFRRNADGSLRRVQRRLPGHRWERARPNQRLVRPTSALLQDLSQVPMTTAEVRWLFGLPSVHRDTGRGIERRTLDDYAVGCELNELTGMHYDPVGLVRTVDAMCICGFCAALANHREAVALGTPNVDSHYTSGPFVRIGDVLVTPEHRVVTPSGPRAAQDLRTGDEVLTVKGPTRVTVSWEPDAGVRRSVNVRTTSGRFEVGGLWLQSETAGHCTP